MARQRAWTGPDPADITSWSVVQAGHLVGHLFHAAFAEHGITPIQFGVLLLLDTRPGMANNEMARTVLISPQSMSELLAGLVRQGLVRRGPSAGRGHRIPTELTAAGRATLRRCQASVAVVEEQLGLSAQDGRRLNRLLRSVLDG